MRSVVSLFLNFFFLIDLGTPPPSCAQGSLLARPFAVLKGEPQFSCVQASTLPIVLSHWPHFCPFILEFAGRRVGTAQHSCSTWDRQRVKIGHLLCGLPCGCPFTVLALKSLFWNFLSPDHWLLCHHPQNQCDTGLSHSGNGSGRG